MTLLWLCAASAAVIALATLSWLTVGAVRDWRLRARVRELRRLNADPSQSPIGV